MAGEPAGLSAPGGPRLVGHDALAAWLAERLAPGAPLRIVRAERPSGGGWSSQTWFIDAVGDDGPPRRLVLKMPPARLSMFRVYDLSREHACLRALADRWPPVPRVVGHDWDGAILGVPFYVMERVAGLVPADDKPTFMEAGFLFDAGFDVQRHVYDELVRAIVALQAVDPGASGLEALTRRDPGATPLARELAWLRDLFEWGHGPAPQPLIEAAFARSAREMPDLPDAGLSWGDARPANAIFADFRLAALLDWELATLGPRELDLFWFLEMNAMRARGRPLAGFRSDADTIAFYAAEAGTTVRAERWFRHFSALKIAVLMLRHLLQRVDAGLLPPDHPVLTDNIALRRLVEFDRPHHLA